MKVVDKLKTALRTYNVEPIVFFYMIGYNLSSVCFLKLIQDKVCRHEFQLDHDFCANIHIAQYAQSQDAIKVFGRATYLNLISTVTTAFPTFASVMFVGPWLDKFRIAPKVVMCLTTFFAIVEALLFLLNTYFLDMNPWWLVFAKLPNSFTGSIMLTYTCVFTYAMKETYTRNRTLRLNILESAIIFPSPIAYMSSSFLSETHPWIVPGQTLNYIGVFFVSLCSYSIAFLCSIVFLKPVNVVNDPQPVLQSKRLSICNTIPTFDNELLKDDSIDLPQRNSLTTTKLPPLSEAKVVKVVAGRYDKVCTSKSTVVTLSSQIDHIKPKPIDPESRDWRILVSELFKLNNIKAIYEVSVKKRADNGRSRIWAVYLLYTLVIIVTMGCSIIMVSYVEHTYGWTASYYQYIDGFGKLVLGLMSTLVLHFLSKVGKVRDTKIIMVGIFCAFFMNSLRAVFNDPRGLYLSYAFGSVLLAGLVGCRAVVSKLIPVEEQGSVMSAMSAIYALAPMVGSLVYSKLFEISLVGLNGLPFAGGSMICVFAMVVVAWLDYSMKE